MLYRHLQDGSLWEVEDDGGEYVSCSPQGGGFCYTLPRYIFEEQLVPVIDSPFGEYRTGTVCIDGDVAIPCYLNDRKWNGWAVPYFTKEVGMNQVLCEYMGPEDAAWFDVTHDRFSIKLWGTPEDEIEYAPGQDIVVDGKTIHVYQIGDGWCWDEV